MVKGSSQSAPSLPPDFDPAVRRVIQNLYDRVNFLLTQVEQLQRAPTAAPVEGRIAALEVSLQAATDALTQATTFVGFGQNLPGAVTGSVQVTGSGVGYALTGPSSAVVITVTNAATARAATSSAIATNVLGAPGTHTVPIPALTGGGAAGSITFNNDGTITAFVDPT